MVLERVSEPGRMASDGKRPLKDQKKRPARSANRADPKDVGPCRRLEVADRPPAHRADLKDLGPCRIPHPAPNR